MKEVRTEYLCTEDSQADGRSGTVPDLCREEMRVRVVLFQMVSNPYSFLESSIYPPHLTLPKSYTLSMKHYFFPSPNNIFPRESENRT